MVLNSKISHTILEFGKSQILSLPQDYTKEEFEAVINIIVVVWNAVVMDSWENNNKFETELLKTIESTSKQGLIEVKRLIKRKKTKFASDPRGVSNYWIREQNGEYIFGCEARLDVEHAPADNTSH